MRVDDELEVLREADARELRADGAVGVRHHAHPDPSREALERGRNIRRHVLPQVVDTMIDVETFEHLVGHDREAGGADERVEVAAEAAPVGGGGDDVAPIELEPHAGIGLRQRRRVDGDPVHGELAGDPTEAREDERSPRVEQDGGDGHRR